MAECWRTVQELVHEDEVVLYGFFVKLSKVALAEGDKTVKEFEYQRSIGIALGDCNKVDILVLDMAEGGAAQSQDRRTNLGIGDDLNAEDIGETGSTVVAEGSKDEVFTFLIEY